MGLESPCNVLVTDLGIEKRDAIAKSKEQRSFLLDIAQKYKKLAARLNGFSRAGSYPRKNLTFHAERAVYSC